MTEAIRTSKKYRALMSIINLSGLEDKESRLLVARKLLNRNIDSYTELSEEEVDILYNAFHSWHTLQKERFENGSSFREACAIWDLMSDDTRLLLNERGILPDKKTRRENLPMTDKEIEKEIEELKSKYSSDYINKTLQSANIVSSAAPTISSKGRWDRWRIIESPSVSLGLSMGIGGIPRGKIIQFWGKNHAGKSMMGQMIAASALRKGIPTYYFDAESAIEADFAEHLGLNTSNELFHLLRPKTINEMCTDIRTLSGSGALIIVDSIAGSESEQEFERQLGKKAPMVGGNASVIKSTLNITRPTIIDSGTTLVIINQARKNFDAGMFGDPDKPYGPEALMHNCDIIYKVESAVESQPQLKDKGYLNTIFRAKKNRLGEKVACRLAFKPGFPYNRSLDLIRVAKESLGKDADGIPVIYEEAAGQPMATNAITENNGSRELIGKSGRYSIKVDSLMLAAILKDEPDFEADDFINQGIQPCDNETLQEFIKTHDAGDESLYNGEDAVWGWFTVPRRGEGAMFSWLQSHPLAREVIIDRMYNALNHKHDLVTE